VTRPRRFLAAASALLLAAALGGCAGTVSMQPAAGSNDPACAAMSVRLPDSIAGQERRYTDAQATGAWGTPTSILLTCGLEAPGPSTLRCQPLSGVDWLVDESEADENRYTFTTYGRDPAVQVYLDYDVTGSGDALGALSPILNAQLPRTGQECIAAPSTEDGS
jgi:hypothetical protein